MQAVFLRSNIDMQRFSGFILLVTASLMPWGCSKSDDSNPVRAGAPLQQPAPRPTVSVDPCAFFTQQQLQTALGISLGPGQRTANEPSCRFTSNDGGNVSVAIPSGSVSEAEFNSWRQMAGADAEVVNDVGDAAYLWKSRMYVRKGTRTFTVSVDDIPFTAATKKALIELGRAGATKL